MMDTYPVPPPTADAGQPMPAIVELDLVRAQLHDLDEEGRGAVEHVNRLEEEVALAQSELAAQRRIKDELAQQVEASGQHSSNAYHRNSAVIAQNTEMQRELQELRMKIVAARAEAQAETRRTREHDEEFVREKRASQDLVDQLAESESENEELVRQIQQQEREKQHEHEMSRRILAELQHLQTQGGHDVGADGGIMRQVQVLEAENAQLMQELSQWQQQAAKQAEIHATVGEMSSRPMQLVAANAEMADEIARINSENKQRRSTISHLAAGSGR
jgi:DNA repair exonuclease SbcCD ATPase subunit